MVGGSAERDAAGFFGLVVEGVESKVVLLRDVLGEFGDFGVHGRGVFADVDAVVHGCGDALGEGVDFDAAGDDVDCDRRLFKR